MTDLARYGPYTLDQDGCTACGDVGIPVRVIDISPHRVLCEDRVGRRAEIAIDFTPGVKPGDVLLIHMGVAIARIEPE